MIKVGMTHSAQSRRNYDDDQSTANFGSNFSLHIKTQKDRQKVISAAIREVADRLCTDLGELECPIDKLREIADEVDAL